MIPVPTVPKLIYDFVLFPQTKNVQDLLARIGAFGVTILTTYNEGNSIQIRAAFPPRTLRRFQDAFPVGWVKKVG